VYKPLLPGIYPIAVDKYININNIYFKDYTSRSGHIQILHRSKKLTLARLFHKIKEGKLQAKKNNSKFPVDTGFLSNNTSMATAILVIAYMGCPESFRTFKIARPCVDLAGRSKCYSLVMSLTNCVAKTALPYLA
jgi:hypothetical protein